MSPALRMILEVQGTVQGVGFRPFVLRLANELGLSGVVSNHGGLVRIEVEGERSVVDDFIRRLQTEAPPLAVVRELESSEAASTGGSGFSIVVSTDSSPGLSAIPPDVATCASCLEESMDSSDRRFRHPFICCVDCGPRFTVVRTLPYDRASTSMASFGLCEFCIAEYADPTNRRFHAQAVSCATCGPQLTGSTLDKAIELLCEGKIVAVKGLGGYQLMCRSDSSAAVQLLRDRKHREEKPFALLVESADEAARLVVLDHVARQALAGPEAPIVLAPAKPGNGVASEVAPGTGLLGVMLPSTPLHSLIIHGVGVALVCTSGNRSNEPIIADDTIAATAFASIADGVVSHDRPIERRADDSVGQVVADRFQLLRRARGFAPRSVSLPSSGPVVLGVGAELKSTTCFAVGDQAALSVHLGDLENPATLKAFELAIADQLNLAQVEPELVVHDMHPEYLSTKFALAQPLAPTLAVQHHHAHLVSCLVDNQFDGSAIGVIFDGFGWGDDGTAWGGEFLVGDANGYERAAFLQPLPLPGGAKAIREPWRMAVAHCLAAFDDEVPSILRGILKEDRIDAVAALCADAATLRTTSIGRLFDAVAALCGLAKEITYEGEAAIALEGLAAGCDQEHPGYRWLDTNAADVIRAIVADIEAGVDRSVVAYRFHRGLADFVVDTCVRLRESTGLNSVALSGGVFQNRLLVELVIPLLGDQGFDVMRHSQVPPNDGGISLGQVAIGRAHLA